MVRNMIERIAIYPALVLLVVGLGAGPVRSAQSSSQMRVEVTVMPRVDYRIVREPAALVIPGDAHEEERGGREEKHEKEDREGRVERHDRRRMEMKIKNGTIVSVETNSTDGYILSLQSVESHVFTSVRIKVEGIGESLRLTPGGSAEAHIPYNGKRRDLKRLSYVFTLSPEARPGSYPWPIVLTIRSF